MIFDLYAAVSSLAVSSAHFLIGSWKCVLLWCLFIFLARSLCLEYSSSDESDESDKEESDKLGYEFRSAGTFSIILGVLLRGVGLHLGVIIYADDAFDVDGGSLAVPWVKNVHGEGTREILCIKCTGYAWVLVFVGDAWSIVYLVFRLHDNIFSISRISYESLIDPVFFKSDGMGWYKLEWFRSAWIELESLWFQIIEFSRPTFSTSKLFSRSASSRILFQTVSSLYPESCLFLLQLLKYYTHFMGSSLRCYSLGLWLQWFPCSLTRRSEERRVSEH